MTEALDRRLALAARDGIIDEATLLALGLTDGQIRARLRRGTLWVVHDKVYAVGTPEVGIAGRRRAALIRAGEGTALTHAWAAVLCRLAVRPAEGADVDVAIAPDRRLRVRGIRAHRLRLAPADVHEGQGLRWTARPRTLIDLCDTLPAPEIRRVVDDAANRLGLTRHTLATALARAPGRRAHAVLGPLVEVRGELTRSELERLLLARLRAAGVPEPIVNVRRGRTTPDLHWPSQQLTVEVDSYQWHSSRAARHRDAIRDAHREAAGEHVQRYGTDQIRESPDLVVAAIGRWLGGFGRSAHS